MGYSKQAYEYALNEVAARKTHAEQLCEERKEQIYDAVPALRDIEDKISAVGRAAVRSASMLDGTEEIIRYKQKYDEFAAEKARILSAAGLSENDFKPKYACSKCGDTGYCAGVMCDCARTLARQYEFDRLNSKMPLKDCTFDTFKLSYYQGAAAEKMAAVLSKCRQFAEWFAPGCSGLIFMGKTGVGKTHLSLAIANEVLKKGFGVIYGTAQGFLSSIEREHFGRTEGDTLELLSECDLLIIDDLGAEFATQFTVSAIYNILNGRIMEGKPTVISTNLTPSELAAAYGERISSRIIGNFEPLKFEGNDVRQIKMMERLSGK